MCRCCQNCWEDFYWNCFEEKFCYDESIANYNPEEDEEYMASQQKNGGAGHYFMDGRMQQQQQQQQQQQNTNDNNNLTVPICNQPTIRRNNSSYLSSSKLHEDDFRRETQINVPMLGPEILAVFANSQIFQDHQPTKLNRITTKQYLAGIHSPGKDGPPPPTTPRESEQERLIRRLEANLNGAGGDAIDSTQKTTATSLSTAEQQQQQQQQQHHDYTPEKRITFTLSADSSPEGSQTLTPKKFEAIAEEEMADGTTTAASNNDKPVNASAIATTIGSVSSLSDEVILRPRLIDRHPHLLHPSGGGGGSAGIASSHDVTPRKLRRSATSVPHFNVRSAASETDIFAITGSGSRISMTPEVPSISFSNLPKNYEDTPTIEKYRVSQSLYSIQTANAARATQDDYSMPRYFRRSAMLMTQSSEVLTGGGGGSSSGGGGGGGGVSSSTGSMSSSSKEDIIRRPEKKSKRLQMLRGTLPPLLIHSVSFRKNRDEGKQVD